MVLWKDLLPALGLATLIVTGAGAAALLPNQVVHLKGGIVPPSAELTASDPSEATTVPELVSLELNGEVRVNLQAARVINPEVVAELGLLLEAGQFSAAKELAATLAS